MSDTPTPTAQARLEAAYEAMQARNGEINAVLDVFNDTAISEMLDADERAENGRRLSAIDGLPVAVSASVGVEGRFHHGGLKAYASRRAEGDAAVVARLRAAGAVVTGTLNQPEGGGAGAHNPWFGDVVFEPGVGGVAAAVAAGFCEAAVGLDTQGGLRRDAVAAGSVAFRAGRNAALVDGIMPLSPTLDAVCVVSNTLDTAAAVMGVVLDRSLDDGVAGDVFDASAKGASLPFDLGELAKAADRLLAAERAATHAERFDKAPGGFSEGFAAEQRAGEGMDPETVAMARRVVETLRASDTPDFLLLPIGAEPGHTLFASLSARPSIAFRRADGAGVELVGPRGSEADLLATVRSWLA